MYSCNKAGNVQTHTTDTSAGDGTPVTFSYDGDLMTEANGVTLDYDENGNMKNLPYIMTTELKYTWDGLLRYGRRGSGVKTFRYDPSGNRIFGTHNKFGGSETKYIVDVVGDLPVILLEINARTDDVNKTYIYANSQIIAQHDGDYSDARYFYLHDRLGSVRQIIDSDADVVNYYTYKPFGETYLEEYYQGIANPFRFTGQYYDGTTGEYDLRNRWYDPVTFRFTAHDPITGMPGKPLSLHKYLYCGNDPINKIDPWGLWVAYVTGTGMASFGPSGVRQSGFIFDDKGNIALMNITGIGGGIPGAFAGISIGWYPWAENIDEIKDIGVTLGGSGRLFGGSAGLEFMFGRRFGIEVSFGGSIPTDIPVEFHSHVTKTELYQKVNVWDLYENLEERLFEVRTVGEGWAYLSVQALLEEHYMKD